MSVPTVDEHWRRFHPATPVVKGWQPLAAGVALGVQEGGRGTRLAVMTAAAIAIVVASAAGYYLNWRVSRYRLEGQDLVVETGVVMKRSRRVPLARLQAVDVVRPLVARALGLSELRLEVAGGKESNASLAYLDDEVARAVRNDLLVLAAGLRDDVAVEPSPPEADESFIARTSTARLAVTTLVAGFVPAALVLGAFVASAAAAGARRDALLAAVGVAVPIFLSVAGPVWATFARNYGSTLADSPDGLRIRRGLLETRAQTVPPGRVQGVVLRESIPWRWLGWVRVSATVAGYDGGSGSGGALLLPVAERPEASAVIDRVLPGVAWESVALAGAPPRARWRAPVEAPALAVGVGDEGADRVLVTTRGRLGRRVDIVPLARVQSVRMRQGPFQRWLRLATVHADLSTGPVRAAALHRDESDARALVDQLALECRLARAAARPEQWLRPLRSPP